MRQQSPQRDTSLSLVVDGPARRSGVSPQRGAMQDVEWAILMAHAQAGDAGAYRRLLEEITPYLRSLAWRQLRNRHDVEDTVQDVLLTVHSIRYTYDPTRPFAPWLVTIANRRLVDRLRRQGRSVRRESPLTVEHETFAAEEANIDEDVINRRSLYEAVQKLPDGQRQAIQLLKLGEMSLKEASASTGLSVTALKVATHRALKNLRKLLSDGSRGT